MGCLILTQQMDSDYSAPEKNQLEIICMDSADISTKLNVKKLNPTWISGSTPRVLGSFNNYSKVVGGFPGSLKF